MIIKSKRNKSKKFVLMLPSKKSLSLMADSKIKFFEDDEIYYVIKKDFENANAVLDKKYKGGK